MSITGKNTPEDFLGKSPFLIICFKPATNSGQVTVFVNET
jgi:hypothetical protein